MLLLALLSVALVFSLILPAWVAGALAIVPRSNDHSSCHLTIDSSSFASAIALNMTQGPVTPMVAAGYWHTVGLKSDGTVVAVGGNDYGQCNVGGWTDIFQVAADGYWNGEHTVGLKTDGTVVAVGANGYGQCNVGGWTDIFQIAAGGHHTVGLKSDSAVTAVGFKWYGQCNVGGWTDITQIAAGREFTIGLKSDGTVVAAGPEIELAKILLLIKAKLNSPAELRVYDSQGCMTGVIDGEVRDEILWATFNQEDESISVLYGFDAYFYEIEGISSGSYGLTMDVVNEGQTTTFSVLDIPITPEAIDRYYIDWYALSVGEPGITIEKDYDGDGEVDEIIITGIPTPINPSPINNAIEVPLDKTLSWACAYGEEDVTCDIYFGTETNPPLVSESQTETTYSPTLNPDTTYYWRVTAINEHSIFSAGALWEFTTEEAPSLCFIATAAYGTPMAEEVQILREFRDEYLLTNPVGQGLVEFYYKVSPPMAEFITEHPNLKPIVRAGLVPAVVMSTIAVNTTPVEKAAIIGLLVLVSVTLAIWAKRRRGRGPEYT